MSCMNQMANAANAQNKRNANTKSSVTATEHHNAEHVEEKENADQFHFLSSYNSLSKFSRAFIEFAA